MCRALGKSALAGLLLVLLLVSGLASVAPCLHHWLHSDNKAPAHYCLVTVLEHGQTEAVSPWLTLLGLLQPVFYNCAPAESFFISHDLLLHPERGPPALS